MSDNLTIKDGAGASKVLQATDNTNVYTPAHQIVRPDGTVPLKPVAEDAAHSSGDTGIMALGVRADAAASTAGSDGDYAPFITDANGKLWCNAQISAVIPGSGATNLGKAEDAAHASADVGVMALGVRQDTPGNLSGTDGDYEPLQVSAGRLWVSAVITSPGTAAASLGKAEDAAHTSGDVGVMSLGVRNDTHTNALSGTDGDYTPIQTDSSGKVGIRGTFAEDAAHSSGDLGLAVLARRIDVCASSAGSSGDYATINQDANGRAWGRSQDDGPAWTSSFGVSGVPVTSSDQSGSAVAVTDAPTSTQKVVVTDVTISVAAAMTVTLTEETSGTVVLKLYMAANTTVTRQFRGKKKLATADKKLMVQTSATGAISVDVGYYSEA